MFVTQEILERREACKAGQKWFSRHYPNGAEMIDVIHNPKVANSFLYWGYEHLNYNKKELEAYLKRLNIEVEDYRLVVKSEQVREAKYIYGCSNITSSSYIFRSKNIVNSNNVANSNFIEHSEKCFLSDFCFNSSEVLQGSNINDSNNIVKSNFIVESSSVSQSCNITKSQYINCSSDIVNSYFIAKSQGLENCLFCYDMKNDKNLLFNKKVSEIQIKIIKQQLQTILKDWSAQLIEEENWSSYTIPLLIPKPLFIPWSQYQKLPDAFWDWVKTLPGYDESVLVQLTLNNKAYKEN